MTQNSLKCVSSSIGRRFSVWMSALPHALASALISIAASSALAHENSSISTCSSVFSFSPVTIHLSEDADRLLIDLAQLKIDIEIAKIRGQIELARVLYGSLEKKLREAQKIGLPVDELKTYTQRLRENVQVQIEQERQRIETAEANEQFLKPWIPLHINHEAVISKSVSFSHDNQSFSIADVNQNISVYDAQTGKEMQKFSAAKDNHPRFASSADGRFTAISSEGKGHPPTIVVVNHSNGQIVATLTGHKEESVSALAISADGNFVATGNNKGEVLFWNISTSHEQPIIEKIHDSAIQDIAFRPDGKFMAAASEKGHLQLWKIKAKKLKASTHIKFDGSIDKISLASSNRVAFTSVHDKRAYIWDPNQGILQTLAGHTEAVRTFAISSDEKWLITGSEDGRAIIWDLATGQSLRELPGHPWTIHSLAVSPDGRFIVAGGYQSLFVWPVDSGMGPTELQAHTRAISRIVFSPDSQAFVTTALDSSILLWRHDHEGIHQ